MHKFCPERSVLLSFIVISLSSGCLPGGSIGGYNSSLVVVDVVVDSELVDQVAEVGPLAAGVVINNDGDFFPLILFCEGADGTFAFDFDEFTWEAAQAPLRARLEFIEGSDLASPDCPEISVRAEAREIEGDGFGCQQPIESIPPSLFGRPVVQTEERQLGEDEAVCHFNFWGIREEPAAPTPVELRLGRISD